MLFSIVNSQARPFSGIPFWIGTGLPVLSTVRSLVKSMHTRMFNPLADAAVTRAADEVVPVRRVPYFTLLCHAAFQSVSAVSEAYAFMTVSQFRACGARSDSS